LCIEFTIIKGDNMDKAVTYSFLAAIKEQKGNIKSLIEIYEELVKALVLKLFKYKQKEDY
jgi:hypothetical protein